MKRFTKIMTRFPLVTFLVGLGVLLALIIVGTKLRAPQTNDTGKTQPTKAVEVFDATEDVRADVSAQVERTDTVVLRATASGVVTRALADGAMVWRGTTIAALADTYGGTSTAGAAAAAAAHTATYQDTIAGTQEDIYRAQDRDINKADDRAAKIARKQLYLTQRASAYAREAAHLQAAQAAAAAAQFVTVAPFHGRIEEMAVHVGDAVTRGDVIAVVRATAEGDAFVTAHVGAEMAAHVDAARSAMVHFDNADVAAELVHIAGAAAQDQSYALTYRITTTNVPRALTDGRFVDMQIPLIADGDILVPVDAVRFGVAAPEVYIVSSDTARAQHVTLGDVLGDVVVVTEGLDHDATVILDRAVTDGEHITVAR